MTTLPFATTNNVKQMPNVQYVCNITQLYNGACVLYIIILTNEVQSLLPWVKQMIHMLQSHEHFRPLVCVNDGMVSGCVLRE